LLAWAAGLCDLGLRSVANLSALGCHLGAASIERSRLLLIFRRMMSSAMAAERVEAFDDWNNFAAEIGPQRGRFWVDDRSIGGADAAPRRRRAAGMLTKSFARFKKEILYC